jgi:multidrug efflux pump subunit AcrB
MKLTDFALNNRTTLLVLTALAVFGGLQSYSTMGRLEDPEFTIKDALVITPYPGATAREVEEEVSDELELAVQKLGQLDEVESKSDRGLSTLTVTIKNSYDKTTLPQVWDELRRKVGDAQQNLPPGAGPSLVVDDFGDVYGVFVAVYGQGYTYAELKDVADLLRLELLLVQDVAKIELFGVRPEIVYVEFDRDRMSQLGISTDVIVNELRQKNVVTDAGKVKVGTEFISIEPTGVFDSVEDFESMLLTGGPAGSQIFLRDVADIRRGYVEPPNRLLSYDGSPAVGLGISTVSGGNVVTMGDALEKRARELLPDLPLGIEFGIIALQSQAVTDSIKGFVSSLLQAIGIVVVVLLIFMGLRSGLLIGFILFLTIAASFILMKMQGVMLERISLGALIIALGMLVDNAIVVVDGMLIRMQQGDKPDKAATSVVAQTAWPLLGATAVAIIAFAAIGTSQDSTGEYCRSLFQVIFISLGLSWLTAVTVTPLLGVIFLKVKKPKEGQEKADPYDSGFYALYRRFLTGAIRVRWVTMAIVVGVFMAALWGFGFIDSTFFPDSTRPQFMVDVWQPQGTHIDVTAEKTKEIEEYLQGLDATTHVTTVVGGGAMRFLLTYSPEKENSAFTEFLVDVDDYKKIKTLQPEIQAYLDEHYPEMIPNVRLFMLGPGDPGKIQARFYGPDPSVLRSLAEETEAIFHADPNTIGIRADWGERVKRIDPVIAEEQANLNGITRADVARAMQQGFQGTTIGIYREGDDLLPIALRAPEPDRSDVASMQNLQIWSPAAGRTIPLRQVVSSFETVYEDDIIFRMDRKRAIKVIADPKGISASTILARVRPQVEAIPRPPGYTLEWWGEYRDSGKAQAALAGSIPMFVVIMIVIVIALFNNLRQPLIIWLVVPLALIGVTVGLLLTNQPFGFMALLGFLSLSGMLIKNAIVLIDQVNIELRGGKDTFNAVVDAAVSRLRPVGMAAATTILGMAPLFPDPCSPWWWSRCSMRSCTGCRTRLRPRRASRHQASPTAP